MNVAIFSSHIHWNFHYATQLEIIQQHINDGDEIIQLVCNSELPTCDLNIDHDLKRCSTCCGKRNFGVSLLEGAIIQKDIIYLTDQDKTEIREIRKEFSTVKELQKLRVDNFDLGYAVASSLISRLRDPNPDLVVHAELLKDLIISSLAVYRSIINFLNNNTIDRFYIFNGRLVHVKPVLRACQLKNVDCLIHERGNSKDHYSLYVNTTPHDINYINNCINQAWENKDSAERERDGRAFFDNRAQGVVKSWTSYTANQEIGMLPRNWNSEKTNIVIFNSSEDEFASIGEEWNNPIYTNQLEGITKIIQDALLYKHLHIYLRVHPNLINVDNKDKSELYSIQSPNFTLIPAESPISTYDLLNAADKIITFGSTIGIEAVYWGKPSILAGKSFYYYLGATYNPSSHNELMDLLFKETKPLKVESALKYGNYAYSHGTSFEYYKSLTLTEGLFMGKDLGNLKNLKLNFFQKLLWKPLIRNFSKPLGRLHKKYLLKKLY